MKTLAELQQARERWCAEHSGSGVLEREAGWSQSLAVGSKGFAEEVKAKLGIVAKSRRIIEQDGVHLLREQDIPYRSDFGVETGTLSDNSIPYFAE